MLAHRVVGLRTHLSCTNINHPLLLLFLVVAAAAAAAVAAAEAAAAAAAGVVVVPLHLQVFAKLQDLFWCH